VHRPIWPRRIVDSSAWIEAGFCNAWSVACTTYGLLSQRNVATVMYIIVYVRWNRWLSVDSDRTLSSECPDTLNTLNAILKGL